MEPEVQECWPCGGRWCDWVMRSPPKMAGFRGLSPPVVVSFLMKCLISTWRFPKKWRVPLVIIQLGLGFSWIFPSKPSSYWVSPIDGNHRDAPGKGIYHWFDLPHACQAPVGRLRFQKNQSWCTEHRIQDDLSWKLRIWKFCELRVE